LRGDAVGQFAPRLTTWSRPADTTAGRTLPAHGLRRKKPAASRRPASIPLPKRA